MKFQTTTNVNNPDTLSMGSVAEIRRGWQSRTLAKVLSGLLLVLAIGVLSGCDEVSVDPQGGGGSSPVLVRVNAGGGQYVDNLARVWSADTGFNTGEVLTVTSPISGTSNPGLYQQQRYDEASLPELIYSYGLPQGNVTIRLHFAEIAPANFGAGLRVFDVYIEDQLVLDDMDIYSQAGGGDRALIRSFFDVPVNDGQLNIRLDRVVGDPQIAAIEVFTQAPDFDDNPPTAPADLTGLAGKTQVSLNWQASTDDAGTVAGYRIFRDGVEIGTSTTTSFTDSGLTLGTDYTYGVTAFDDASPANESGASEITVTTLEGTADALYRLNAGGDQYTDSIGQSWSGDGGYNTGQPSAFGAGDEILGTIDDPLYQDQRVDTSDPPVLTYSLNVPGGNYEVRLHFAENNPANYAVGQRLFDVEIENQLELDDYDIFFEAGGGNRAVVETITGITVSDNVLSIAFIHVADNPTIAAIEVIPLTAGGDSNPPTVPQNVTATPGSTEVALSWQASTDAEGAVAGYRIYRDGVEIATTTATDYTDTGLSFSTNYNYGVTAFDDATPANESAPGTVAVTTLAPEPIVLIRVNNGGPDYRDSDGNLWKFDYGFNTGTQSSDGLGTETQNTEEDLLYQVQRYDESTGPEMTYSYPVVNGNYDVRLHFAETSSAAFGVGLRTFDVFAEAALIFDDLDVFAEAGGGNIALIKTISNIAVSDGTLTIGFQRVVGDPTIAAIEVIGLPSGADPNPPTTPPNLTGDANNTTVSLDWDDSTDAEGSVSGYRVYRDGLLITTVEDTEYLDIDLATDTSYQYQVTALDDAVPENESAPATVLLTTDKVIDGNPPTQPGPITAIPDNTSVVLSWSESSDVEGRVTRYQVYRDGVQIATTDTIHYVDSGLTEGTSYNYEVSAVDDAVPSNESSREAVTATTLDVTRQITIRINAGGPAYTDTRGNLWRADQQFNRGEISNAGVGRDILATEDDFLFWTSRYDLPGGADLVYNINVPVTGLYDVRLYFSENFYLVNGPGLRIFDVLVENVPALSGIDIFAEAGGRDRMLVRVIEDVLITDGKYRLTFIHDTQNPIISAIELVGDVP